MIFVQKGDKCKKIVIDNAAISAQVSHMIFFAGGLPLAAIVASAIRALKGNEPEPNSHAWLTADCDDSSIGWEQLAGQGLAAVSLQSSHHVFRTQ